MWAKRNIYELVTLTKPYALAAPPFGIRSAEPNQLSRPPSRFGTAAGRPWTADPKTVPDRDAMKHPTSRLLHAYWNGLRGARAAPERGEIEPGEIRHVLADSLILEIDAPRQSATVRLAGTRLCALFGAELRASPSRPCGARRRPPIRGGSSRW